MGVMHILHRRPLGEEQGCTEGCTLRHCSVVQVPSEAGWLLDCSEPVGLDCPSACHSSPGRHQCSSPVTTSNMQTFCSVSALHSVKISSASRLLRPDLTATCNLQTLAPAKALGPLGYAAGAAFLVGFAWETVADLQKFWLKSKHPDKCAPECFTLHLHNVHDARRRFCEAVTVAGERVTGAMLQSLA